MYWRTVGFLPTGGWYFLKWNKTSKYNFIIYAAKSKAKCFRLSTEAASENDIVGESVPTNFKFWKFIQNEWVHNLPYDFIRIEGNSHNVLSHPQPRSVVVKLPGCAKQLKDLGMSKWVKEFFGKTLSYSSIILKTFEILND